MTGNSFTFTIRYTKAADKFLCKYEDIRKQYEEAIKKLLAEDHSEKVDVKRIQGKRNSYYRIRLGNYRVVYAVINGVIVVINTLIAGPRGDIYKKLGNLD